jgi:hypothetical protein
MNYGFKSPLFKVATADGRNFTLLDAVDYQSKDGTLYRIPGGADSDGASVPRPFWNVIPPFGRHWPAAYLHDAAYRDTLMVWAGGGLKKASVSEDRANDLLLEAMESLGVPWVEMTAIHEAVVLAGKAAFNEDRKATCATQ